MALPDLPLFETAGALGHEAPMLRMWGKADFQQLLHDKLLAYGREHTELNIVLFHKVALFESSQLKSTIS